MKTEQRKLLDLALEALWQFTLGAPDGSVSFATHWKRVENAKTVLEMARKMGLAKDLRR